MNRSSLSDDSETQIIHCGMLFDGTGSHPVPDALIVVDGGRISAVGPADSTAVPSVAVKTDLGACFVLPGLVDSHSHASLQSGTGDEAQWRDAPVRQALRATANLRRDLWAGTTTMRLMGEEHFLDIELREAIQSHVILGPRLLCATRSIASSNAYGRALSAFDGVEEIRRGIRENFHMGADLVKILVSAGALSPAASLDVVSYCREEIRTAVEEAARVGQYVAAHMVGGPGLPMVVEEGVATVEHGSLLTDEDVALMICKGTWLICTLSVYFHPTGLEQGEKHDPATIERLLQAREKIAANFPRILKSGVRFAVGSDAMHGLLPFELEMLVRLGVSPQGALLAATREAAKACRVIGETGTIEIGKRADIIGVEGNPLDDIQAMYRVAFVMKEGRVYKEPLHHP